MLPYAWNHSITYSDPDKTMPFLVQRLYARNMNVVFKPDEELIQFSLDTSIEPGRMLN